MAQTLLQSRKGGPSFIELFLFMSLYVMLFL